MAHAAEVGTVKLQWSVGGTPAVAPTLHLRLLSYLDLQTSLDSGNRFI